MVILIEDVLEPAQIFLLLLGVGVLVGRPASKRQCVVRILGMLLMEDIILAVVPVRKTGVVAGGLGDGLGRFDYLIDLRCGSLAFLATELGLVGCRQVHIVRVDDLAFFLEIEGLLVVLHVRLGQLAVVILLVVRIQSLRIRVPDKPVDAAGHPGALVPGR